MTKQFITSESVTEWHPDKICDQISDAILDACLEQDPFSRVACECLITTNKLIIAWEITTKAKVDYEKIARQTIVEIGYDDLDKFFDGNTCDIQILLDTQSSDIAMWVYTGGAGDQWMMFGYATNETESFLPATIHYSHELAKQLAKVRKNLTLPFLLADGKTQVTVEYENDKISRIDTIVVSSQHIKNISQKEIFDGIKKEVILPIVWDLIDENTKIYINPTGSFYIWWPAWDSGLTGRKIIVDTYGGMGHHGGGCFSGKDPSKVDRSGAYMARYVAKNIVAAGLADRCEIQVAYVIGRAEPTSIHIDTFGTGKYTDEQIIEAVKKVFDFRPGKIIEQLDLLKPIYRATSVYGHFGREDFSWEKTDRVEELKKVI